jgi:hypothetical protein
MTLSKMLRTTTLSLCALLSIALCAPHCSASAWTRKQGEVFTNTQAYFYKAANYWDGEHELQLLDYSYHKTEYDFYLEYGLNTDHTLVLQLPYARIVSNKETDGVADIKLGLINNLSRSTADSFSWQISGLFTTGYQLSREPLLGTGYGAVELALLYGHTFDFGYIDTSLGYWKFTGKPSDQVRAALTFGQNLGQTFLLRYGLQSIIGQNNGDDLKVQDSVVNANLRLVEAELALEAKLDEQRTLIMGCKTALWGELTGQGTAYYLGLNARY